MGSAPDESSTDREPTPVLESWIAVGLCMMVLAGSMAVLRTSERIDSALEGIGEHRGPGIPAQRNPRSRASRESYGEPPSLVCLVTVEGLRADCGARLEELRRLGRSGVSFRCAGAQSSRELVSLKSMLTGVYPVNLILEETGADLDVLREVSEPDFFLRDTFVAVEPSLAALFSERGYRTGAFTDGGTASVARGFDPGFDTFDDESRTFDEAVGRAADWLGASGEDAFLFLHCAELDALPAGSDGGTDRAAYDRALARVDASLGALLERLEDQERLSEALILITGSHGMNLGERRGAATGELFVEQLMVPLVLRFPASWPAPGRAEDQAIELVDVAPSLLEACGVVPPKEIDGHSVLPILFRGVRGRRFLVAQTSWTAKHANPVLRSVLSPERWQLIHDGRDDAVEFFSLRDDPSALVPTRPRPGEVPGFVSSFFDGEVPPPGEGAPPLPSPAVSH